MENVCGYILIKFMAQTKGRRHAHDILMTVSFVNTRLDNGLSPKWWQAIFQNCTPRNKRHSWFEPKTPKILRKEYIWK